MDTAKKLFPDYFVNSTTTWDKLPTNIQKRICTVLSRNGAIYKDKTIDCVPIVSPHPPVPTYRLYLGVTMGALSCLGVLLNLFIIFGILRNSSLRRGRHLLFLNFAAAVVIHQGFSSPFFVTLAVSPAGWTFGTGMCKLIPYLHMVTWYVQSWSLTAICVLQYLSVRHPDKAVALKQCHIITLCLIIWCLFLLGNIPVAVDHEVIHSPTRSSCILLHDETRYKAYVSTELVFFFFLPLIAMGILSALALQTIKSTSDANPYGRLGSTAGNELRKEIIMILGLGVAFVLCHGPSHVCYVLTHFFEFNGKWSLEHIISYGALNCISAVNPSVTAVVFIYFTIELRQLLWCRVSGRNSSNRNRKQEHDVTEAPPAQNEAEL